MVAAWYGGLTLVVLVLAYRDRGLRRHTGVVILVAYALFVSALVAAAHGHEGALVLGGPAVLIGLWALLLVVTPSRAPASSSPGRRPISRAT